MDKVGNLTIAALLEVVLRNFSAQQQQVAAIAMLVKIARAAEVAADPVHGGNLIDQIADAAKATYRQDMGP